MYCRLYVLVCAAKSALRWSRRLRGEFAPRHAIAVPVERIFNVCMGIYAAQYNIIGKA